MMIQNIETHRRQLNQQITALRRILADVDRFEAAKALFFEVHAQLHTASISQGRYWSFEDALLDELDDSIFRRLLEKEDHSMAWCLWHLARIEDVAMNLLVADRQQVFNEADWHRQLNVDLKHTGNAMSRDEITALSIALDFQALRQYRAAVGRRTQQIVADLVPEQLRQKVDPARLQRVWDEGALVPAAQGIADYWAGRDNAGLLLMPATRHNLVHLNAALKLERKRG